MPKLRDLTGGTTTKIYCPATACRTCVLSLPRTIKVGLTEVGNQAKPLKFTEKKIVVICFQSRPDVQTYGHPHRYTVDADAAEIGVCTHKCQVAA